MNFDVCEIDCTVSGKVQRVMYRDFAQRKARGLGLRGFVENRDDGSVYIVAQGSRGDLEVLIDHLHRGPFGAHVAHVAVNWREPTDGLGGFKIEY